MHTMQMLFVTKIVTVIRFTWQTHIDIDTICLLDIFFFCFNVTHPLNFAHSLAIDKIQSKEWEDAKIHKQTKKKWKKKKKVNKLEHSKCFEYKLMKSGTDRGVHISLDQRKNSRILLCKFRLTNIAL